LAVLLTIYPSFSLYFSLKTSNNCPNFAFLKQLQKPLNNICRQGSKTLRITKSLFVNTGSIVTLWQKSAVITLLIFCSFYSISQTKRRHFRQKEVGLFGGASYYIGDINPRNQFDFSKPAFGAFYRMAISYRFAFRFGFNYGSVGARDSKSSDASQRERNISFSSQIYDAHAIYEFNFVDYRIGNDKHYVTMFLFAGLGGHYMNPRADIGYGTVNLAELNTEGQSKSYSKYQVNVPFGVGFKWNVNYMFGLGFEWGPRKLFTDYLDDVSGSYPTSGNSAYYGTGLPGTMRGNPRTKDWYFFYGFTLQMRLPKKNVECKGMGIGN
jgi:Domain of unknown function (DUF6089)